MRGARHITAVAICALLGGAGVWQSLGNGGVIGWLLVGFLLLGARFLLRPGGGELALVAKCVAAVAALVAVLVAGIFVAWESGEVVVLRYADGRGGQVEERLWVVDLDGVPSVATASSKRRVALLEADPNVELVRGGRAECRRAELVKESAGDPADKRRVEKLFEEKYGLRLDATRALALFLGAPPGDERVLIRLQPCP